LASAFSFFCSDLTDPLFFYHLPQIDFHDSKTKRLFLFLQFSATRPWSPGPLRASCEDEAIQTPYYPPLAWSFPLFFPVSPLFPFLFSFLDRFFPVGDHGKRFIMDISSVGFPLLFSPLRKKDDILFRVVFLSFGSLLFV